MTYEICKVLESDFPLIHDGMFLHIPKTLAEQAKSIAGSQNNILPEKADYLWLDRFLIGGDTKQDTEEIDLFVETVHYHEEKTPEHIFTLKMRNMVGEWGLVKLRIVTEKSSRIYGKSDRNWWKFFNGKLAQ